MDPSIGETFPNRLEGPIPGHQFRGRNQSFNGHALLKSESEEAPASFNRFQSTESTCT